MTTNIPKLEVTLLDNACHSLNRGFEFLEASTNEQDKLLLKEAVVWIHHGIELSLKQLLVQKNEFLVFDDIDKAVQKLGNLRRKKSNIQIGVLELFDYGETSQTVGYGKAIERAAVMLNLQELAQDKPLRQQLDKLGNFRNRIVHFSIDIYTDEVTGMLVQLMNPFLVLLGHELNNEDFINNCIPEIRKKVDAADYFINERIKALTCTEESFMMRQKQRSVYVDFEETNFEDKLIVFKDGFVRTEYFAHKKLLEEASRTFRDFPCLDKIKIMIESQHERHIYYCEITLQTLETFLDVKFEDLKQDIKSWRTVLNTIDKTKVVKFSENYVSSTSL